MLSKFEILKKKIAVRPQKRLRFLVKGRLQDRCGDTLFLVSFGNFEFLLPTSEILDHWNQAAQIGQMFICKQVD